VYQTGAPPVVVYLSHQTDKKTFRATMLAFWSILDIWVLLLYFYSGLINISVVNFSVFLLPALILGIIVGNKLNENINEDLFKKIIGVILVFTGILLALF
jgi:uncharacterized membrane protein YfcA